MFPGLDLRRTEPVQHLITAGWDLDDLDRDLSVRRVERFNSTPMHQKNRPVLATHSLKQKVLKKHKVTTNIKQRRK